MEESIEESTNFQEALNEEIDHEMLNSGMEFECVSLLLDWKIFASIDF